MSDRIAEIRARLDAATRGPWRRGAEDDAWQVKSPVGTLVATAHFWASHEMDDGIPNAEFIAHAPEDIAYLLGEVARLSQGEP